MKHALEKVLQSASIKKYNVSDIPQTVIINLQHTINIINELQTYFDFDFTFSSTYRDAEHSKLAGSSIRSPHYTGEAIDIVDINGVIRTWLMNNAWFLKKYNCCIEHPHFTKTWCHIQTRPVASKSLAFHPYSVCKLKESNADNRFDPNLQPIDNKKTNDIKKQSDNNMSFFNKLIDKGLDIGLSFIPGGAIAKNAIKTLSKVLLGKENATEKEVQEAIIKASPEELEKVKAEMQKIEFEYKKELEETKQSEMDLLQEMERTTQREFDSRDNLLHFIEIFFRKSPTKSLITYTIFFYSILGIFIVYSLWQQGTFSNKVAHDLKHWEFIEHCIIGLMIIYPTIPVALLFKPIYKIVEAISMSVTSVIQIPSKTIGYVDNTAKGISNIFNRIIK